MRIVDILKDREQARRMLDPQGRAHLEGTPESRAEALKELNRHRHIHKIVSADKPEIARSDLTFERYWIEHTPTGRFYREYGGDPGYPTDAWVAWYVDENGAPHMLERCEPASREELEAKRAQVEARRAAREAAAKEHRAYVKELAGR